MIYIDNKPIEVKRLRGDCTEIVAGSEVAFVALISGIADGVAFCVTDDGALRAKNGAADEKLACAVADAYDFAFCLNGKASHEFRGSPGAQPWIQVLDTSCIDTEYIQVDVEIAKSCPPPPPAALCASPVEHAHVRFALEGTREQLDALELHAKHRFTLCSDHGVRLVLELELPCKP